MNEDDIRTQLVQFARRAYWRGLVGGTGGNFSARLDENRMLITASGVSLAETTIDNLLTVDIQSHDWQATGDWRPSRELLFHAEILRRRPRVGAVLHVHPPHATAYAVAKRGIPVVTDAGHKQQTIPRVPYAPSGTLELKDNVARAIELEPDCTALLLEGHGVITVGEDVPAAYDTADLIEELARIAFLAARLAEE